MSASFCVPTSTRAPLPPSASIKRSELARPISTGMTAPGNSTKLRSESNGRVLGESTLIDLNLSLLMPRRGKGILNARLEFSHGSGVRAAGDLFEQVARLCVVGLDLRRHDLDAAELVTPGAVRILDPAAAQTQPGAAGGAGRDRHRDGAFDGRDLHFGAQRGFAHGDWQVQLDVGILAPQIGIGRDLDLQVEIAGGTAASGRWSALAWEAQPPATLDARRDADLDA